MTSLNRWWAEIGDFRILSGNYDNGLWDVETGREETKAKDTAQIHQNRNDVQYEVKFD